MKKIIIDGRLGKDSEIKTSKTGRRYLSFSVANDTYSNGETKTEWFNVITFDQFTVEKRSEFLKKGRYVIITGSLNSTVNTNNGKIYLNHDIMAESVELPSIGMRRDDSNGNLVEGVSTFPAGQQGYVPKPQQAPSPQSFQPQVAQPCPAQPQVAQPQVARPSYGPASYSASGMNSGIQEQPQAYHTAPAPAYQPQATPSQFSDFGGSEDSGDDLPF